LISDSATRLTLDLRTVVHTGSADPQAVLRPAKAAGGLCGFGLSLHNNRADFDVNQTVDLAYWSGELELTSVLLEDRRPGNASR
jgi:hypothetical protein